MVHIVKQQEVVTYVSPVKVLSFASGIKIFKLQIVPVIALSFSSEYLDCLTYRSCKQNSKVSKIMSQK